VACNTLLRRSFKETFERAPSAEAATRTIPVYYPAPVLTTDNAAMIAAAGTPRLRAAPSLELDLNAFPDLRLC
jgi:N6-L-threonylcarbamoyladenine synthase